MSDELLDEVEAINAIYGEGSLTPDDGAGSGHPAPGSVAAVYVLELPGGASSLRLSFPASYPAAPPAVLGSQHSSGGVRGAGARDLAGFRDALAAVFLPGQVCLFDAFGEFERRWPAAADDPAPEPPPPPPQAEAEERPRDPPPAWAVSEPVTDSKSTFVARVARVASLAQARAYVAHLLASDRRIRSATHNMTAWRIRAGGVSFQDCDDDGEAAAGARLLHLMRIMDLWDAVVVVTRWYGGVKLGPRRFAIINAVACDAFVRAGMVADRERDKKAK